MNGGNHRASRWLVLTCAAVLALSGWGCAKLRARDQLNKGVRSFKAGQYAAAVENFKTACELDPELPVARLYLATAYAQQFTPGVENADNLKMGQMAIEEFQKVLQTDPKSVNSVAGIASLYFNMKKLELAKEWYNKQIELDNTNPEAYYSVGVIDWTQTYQPRMEAKAKAGIQPEEAIKDKKVREPLCEKNLPFIEEGFKMLEKAIELRPDYDDAMAYLNLMWREKADCEAAPAARDAALKKADEWVTKTLDTKKKKAAAQPTGILTTDDPKK